VRAECTTVGRALVSRRMKLLASASFVFSRYST
jgi:hypothetical protein